MIGNPYRMLLASLMLVGIATACTDQNGVVGANFHLRNDSPLPTWFVLPKEVSREQVSVAITVYEATTSPQWKERFVIRDRKNGRVLQEAMGYANWHPDSEREKAPAGTYPNWVIAEVNGTQDVYEQSESNDLLRIVKKH
jgi:hypothetical protein